MLFLDPSYFGQGFGSQILTHLLETDEIKKVDVNEQNEQAKNFYLKNNFTIKSRSEFDDQGKSYPLLHLQYKKEEDL